MNIQSLWIGDQLSAMEQMCIQSFLDHGHEFHLFAYDDIRNVPRGTVVRDARTIMPLADSKDFRYTEGSSVAAFSDVFRLKLLLENGGIWVDMDVICLKPFTITDDYCFPLLSGRIMRGRDAGFSVDSWFLKAPRGSAFIRYCHDMALSYAGRETTWGTLGPWLIMGAISRFALHRFARGIRFFPVNHNRYDLLIEESPVATALWYLFGRYSIAMHLYRSVWREHGVDPDGAFPKNCIYERLKRRHLTASRGNPR